LSDSKDLSFYDLVTGEFTPQEAFAVTDVKSAVWAVGKLHEANVVLSQYDAQYEALKVEVLKRLDSWYDSATAKARGTIEAMESFLRPYAESECERLKSKHVDIPGARLGFHSNPPAVEIYDEPRVIAQVKAVDILAIRTKESVDKTRLKALIEGGTHIEGATVVPGSVRFSVEER